MEFGLLLSNKKTTIKRKAYSILALLGDFGGFNDAIFFIFGTLMTTYSAKMFKSSVAT